MANQYKSTSIRVERLHDEVVHDRLKQLLNSANLKATKLRIQPVFSQATFETPFDVPDGDFKTILEVESVEVNSFTVETSTGITITLRRQLDRDNQKWETFDLLDVSATESAPFGLVAGAIASARKVFRPIDRMAVLEHLTEDQQLYVQQREVALHRLEHMQDDFFQKLQDFSLKQATEAQTNQAKLEEAFNKRTAELEGKYAELRKILDNERVAFDDEKRTFDLRDSTAVRRGIRNEVKELLAERAKSGFELSEQVEKKRNYVFRAYFGLLTVVAIVVGIFITIDIKSGIGENQSPWLIGRQIVSLLALTISAGFFIRWLNAAALRHADDEFQTRKYELDFERASFVVEWALEWVKEQKEVPQFLIERLSRGIFETHSSDAEPATAADAVASALFGSAATAKLKLGDNELTIDRKGIRQLQKNSDSTGTPS